MEPNSRDGHTPETCVPMATLREKVHHQEKEALAIEVRAKSSLSAMGEHLERRIEKLESNQRWGVMTIIGLFMKAVFDLIRANGGV
jgi:hypothetical protein